MKTIKLIPKTARAKFKIKEAGSPEKWVILLEREEISFSDKLGPWLYVRPAEQDERFARWVHRNQDAYFGVEET